MRMKRFPTETINQSFLFSCEELSANKLNCNWCRNGDSLFYHHFILGLRPDIRDYVILQQANHLDEAENFAQFKEFVLASCDETPTSNAQHRDYFMDSARVRDFHTSWCSIWNRKSERSERVRFLILHQRVWKSRTKRFPSCNLFILYILRFSRPQKYILALDKFELRTTRVNRKYYLVKAARQSYPRWPWKSPPKHNSLKPWFVIGRKDFFTCEKLVSPFHTAKFDAKILLYMK